MTCLKQRGGEDTACGVLVCRMTSVCVRLKAVSEAADVARRAALVDPAGE
jgi:hypothetical protein